MIELEFEPKSKLSVCEITHMNYPLFILTTNPFLKLRNIKQQLEKDHKVVNDCAGTQI